MSYYRTKELRREEEGPAIASIYPIVHTEYVLLSRDLADPDRDGSKTGFQTFKIESHNDAHTDTRVFYLLENMKNWGIYHILVFACTLYSFLFFV